MKTRPTVSLVALEHALEQLEQAAETLRQQISLARTEQPGDGRLEALRTLSEREYQVLGMMKRGMPDNEIGDGLGLSLRTVQRHAENIRRKLGARSRQEAVDLYEEATATRAWHRTPRELDILELFERGLSQQDIADHLGISPRTVDTTAHNLYRKLGVHSRAQAVARYQGRA